MKKRWLIILLASAFIFMPNRGSYMKAMKRDLPLRNEISVVLETLTVYNPTTGQCDDTPLITASNAHIDTVKLRNQQLRWMALSRDLLSRWNGKFSYGDTVLLVAGDQQIDGLWIIQDNLNKRYKNRGDLLFATKIRTLGKWKNVRISKSQSIQQPV